MSYAGLLGQSIHDLNEVLNDMEVTIRNYSEVLVADLALRDELAYEKELKNSFISLLLDVQKKRRDTAVADKKHNRRSMPVASGRDTNSVSYIFYSFSCGCLSFCITCVCYKFMGYS